MPRNIEFTGNTATPEETMKRRLQWLPVLALLGLSCMRSPFPPQVPVGDDRSIRFPDFHDEFAVEVGGTSSPYQLDGVTLRALMIAANDYIPPGTQEQDCLDRQEAQLYRVIRQGDIIFVSVSFNFSFCKPRAYPLDGGARYAISTDGRILRRLVGIEPDGFPHHQEPPGESIPVPDSMVGSPMSEPAPEALPPFIRNRIRDAGIGSTPPGPSPAASSPPDGGVVTPDGGAPGGSRDGGL
jgi:hypothetical protein